MQHRLCSLILCISSNVILIINIDMEILESMIRMYNVP